MKKLFFALMLVATVASAQPSGVKATWKNLGTPFVAESIDGGTVDLGAWLDSGYCVVIDYSACWCSPCWNIHTSGLLEQLYNRFGPRGTNRLRIVWCEMEDNNTVSSIRGQGGSTMGDWTNGGTVPYPIIDGSRYVEPCGSLFYGSYPYIVFITPERRYRSLYKQDDGVVIGNTSASISNIASLIADVPVGISDVEASKVAVLPNPATDRIVVQAEGLTSLTLCDMQGHRLATTQGSTMHLGSFPAGNYLLLVATHNGVYTKEIIKQ